MSELEVNELKNCPFCNGKARMEVTNSFRGSGGFNALVLLVEHDNACIIADKSEIVGAYIAFDHESDGGRIAVDGMERQLANRWNRRVG